MNIDDDKILLSALREGNERAFDMIFRKYSKSIYHFVCWTCQSKEDAEDLTQEIFVKLWENAKIVAIVSLKAYLFTIARGMVVDWTRRKVNRLVFETLVEEKLAMQPTESDTEEKILFEQLLLSVQQMAQTMPAKRLEVYKLRWLEGLTRKEIAQRMGIGISTVDIHIRKTLEYLRSTLSQLP
jgi:RNA polymerase sigma-70 factor (ECF subfamily)